MNDSRNLPTNLIKEFLVGSLGQIFVGIVGGGVAFKIVKNYSIYEQVGHLYLYTSILILLLFIFMKSAYGFLNATNRARSNIISITAVFILLIAIATLWWFEITQIHEDFGEINLNFDRFLRVYGWYYLAPNILIVTTITLISQISLVKERIVLIKSSIGRIR
jgi:hypothetical protein